MDIKTRMLNNAQREYQNTLWALEEQKKLLARERRERELADEKRRAERLKDSELKQRLADTLETESRPKPFGGSDYEKYQLEQEFEEQLEVLNKAKKPIVADPEVPQYLKEPKEDSYLVSMLKANPTTLEWGKTSKADRGMDNTPMQYDIYNPSNGERTTLNLQFTDTAMKGIDVAHSVTDEALQGAQDDINDAINNPSDPKHGNFWGDLMTGFIDFLSSPGGNAQMASVGTYGPNINSSNTKKNWARNAVGFGAIRKNEGEIAADANEINRYKELMSRGGDMQRYTENVLQLIDFYDQLDQLEAQPKTRQNLLLAHDLKARINELEKETENLRQIADDAHTYYEDRDYNHSITSYGGSIGAPYRGGNGSSLSALNDIIRANGYRGLSKEQKDAIRKYSSDIDSKVGEVKKEFDDARPDLLHRMADNIRELKSWMASNYNPSEEFTRIAESVTDFNFTDPKTYTHGLPGLIGSSMSFGGYQLASTALGLAAMGVAMAGTGGTLGLGVLGASSIGSTGLGIVGGHYENNTEGFDNYKLVFIDKLNKNGTYEQWQKEGREALGKKDATDDEIMYAMAAGIYEPKEKIKDDAVTSLYGLNNLYKNDMQAVVGSEIFEAGINFFAPMVKFAKASEMVPKDATRFARMRRLIKEHPNSAKMYERAARIKEGLMDSELGAAIGGSVSYPLGLVGRAVEAGIKPLVPKKAINWLLKTFSLSSNIIERSPSTILGAKAIGKNLLDFSARIFGAGWSEAIEEGKQYLNGKNFVDGSYSGASDTLMDAIINDIAGGSRAAYSFIGDMFGATTDRELIANMKGGFLGGFGHTAALQSINAGYNTYQDFRANDFVVNNVLAKKLADRTTIQNNAYLAQQTSPMQYERIMNAFDAMERVAEDAELNNTSGEELNFNVEDVRNQKKAYQEVFNTANSKNVQDAAKALDIRPGTQQYGNLVGLYMWARDIANTAITNVRDIENRANTLVNSLISGVDGDERGLTEILSGLSAGDLMVLNEQLGIVDFEAESSTTVGNRTVYNQNWGIAAIRNHIPAIASYIKEIASLDALFTLRDLLEMMADPTTADKRRLRSVNRQIQKLKSLSQFSIIKNAETADDFTLIPDLNLHDALRDMYRESANLTVDIEEGAAMQYMLLGGKVAGVDFLTSPEMQEAFKNAQLDIKDRKEAALKLIDRYINSVHDDEELRQAIHDTFENTVRSDEEIEEMEMEPEEGPETPSAPSSEPEPTVVPEAPEEAPEEPENGSEEPSTEPGGIQPPASPTPPTAPETEPENNDDSEARREEEEADYDALIAQIEAEYAPTSNTMFTENDVDTDFGISVEDWAKVSDQVKQKINNLMQRWQRFVDKWNGRPLSKHQWAGVHGWVIKFQRDFNQLREEALLDIANEDEKLNRPEPEAQNPTDDQIWENLFSLYLFELQVQDLFDEWVEELQMRWNHFIEARNDTNARLYSEALANVYRVLQISEDNNIGLNPGSIENYLRIKFDIDQLNRTYDADFEALAQQTPPTIDLPAVRYEKPWAQYTTTHTHMESSRGYRVEDSVAMDDPNIRFSDVSANTDFVQNAIFWFTTRQTNGAPKIQLNVMYNGHQFTPIDIHTSDDASGKGRAFYRNVLGMLRSAGDRKVMPQKSAISRSNGIIDDSPAMQTFEQLGLLRDDNMYSIEFSSSQDTFCIVQYVKDANGQEIPVAYIPGQEEGRSKHEVYRYSQVRPDSTKPADGGMVMMIHPPYPEIDKDQKVPINMHYMPLTEGDAQLIVDLLSGKYMLDNNGDYGAHAMENLMFTEDGISKGLTRMQVLRMLIRYKATGERYNPYLQSLRYVEYDRNDQRYVILHGNFGRGVQIPNGGRFNITDANDQKLLKDFLMAYHNKTFTYNEFLRCRINRNNGDFSHPLHGLTEFKESVMGREVFKNGGLLRFGNSTIIFDEKDFGDAAHPEGLSGLAWGMRRGFVQSTFTGFTNTLLNFNEDIPLVYDDQETHTVSTQSQAPKKPETVAEIIDDTIDDNDDDVSLEDMDLMIGEKSKEKFSIEKANEFLRKVLGEEIDDDSISEKLADIARTNASVLGLCHYSGRLMFDPYAPQGTMYHEAFHKIVELILGDRTRKMLYKAYAKKMHIAYKDDKELLSNKEVREGLAEEFRLYMEERPSISLGSLRHPFKTIREVTRIMGKIGDYRLYMFYVLTRTGVTKKLFKSNQQKVLRFLETHGGFVPFSMGGHEFKNILNRYQYRVLRNTLIYLVFRTNDIGLLGDGIENFKISKQAILRDKNYLKLINSNARGAEALKELVENIEFVEADIKNYIYNTFEINRNDDDEAENEQDIEGGEGAMEASFDQLKYSHETSQFSRTGAKVKFILARVPKKRFGYKNGKRVTKNILNDEGLVEYFDVKYVFNTLVNYCHSCRNSKELLNKLAKLGEDNAMFKYIHDEIVSKLYENAQKGDADAEAAFAQLLVSLHAAKGEYVIGKANRDADGTWSVTIQSTDSDYNAREYKMVWSQLFANGSEYLEKTTSGYQMKFRKGTQRRYSPEVFHNIYLFFSNVKEAVLNGSTVTVNYIDENGKAQKRVLDVTKEDEFDYVKEEFCNTLQKLGILFNKDELNYTLATQFGSSNHVALSRLFERTDQHNFTPFLDWINGCYNPVTKTLNITQNGTLNGKNIETAIGSFGFVGMLANAKYKYTHDHDQLSVLATKGNRYYVISENNLITDITDDINAVNSGDTKMMDELKSFSYNYMRRGTLSMGSLLMKQVETGAKLGVVTVAGFRTDQKGDMGQDYAEISPAEDYITKCLILMQGGLIFPTMSDKKTWTYLTGLKIPGLAFIPAIQALGSSYSLTLDRAVLEQMLEYAKCELQSILECIKTVRGYTDEQGTKHPPLAESEKVVNYHKGAEYEGHTIIQGGRFGSLTGIYDEDGKFVSFNRIHLANSDKYVDEVQNWLTAQEYFFGVPDKNKPGMYYIKTKANDKNWSSGIYVNEQLLKEHQFRLLTRLLNKQVEREMDYAASLGLIEKVTTDEKIPVILRYKNKLLDSNMIKTLEALYTHILDPQLRQSAAIAAYMTRISAASNISLQEVERIYAGHPAFFKWKYGSNGELIDRSVDQHKRLGGLISTGQNNVLDIPGIPTKYVCAEVDNDMVGSKMQDELKTMMEDGELRSAYMRTVFEREGITLSNSNSDRAKELAKEMEAMSIDDIKAKLKEENEDIYKMLLKNATKKANDFVSDIDVADGAAYVTDEMCEWMLRMVGSWDAKIERAFKILRGQEVDGKVYTTKDILTLQQAYRDVLTTVIGNQKYTAYGFRFANGVAAPYYNKMALFPMFKCLSTGATAKVFDKMKKEGVHMLMINSAVKVGSQGSKDMAMTNFREDNDPTNEANFNGDIAQQDWKPSYENTFHFNKYEQEFKYIRKQFNTDPHGKTEIKMGTQMTKVAMASMMAGRDYLIVEGIDENGNKIYKTMSAVEVRDDIMNCINLISDLGEQKVRKRFIKETTVKDSEGNDVVQREVDIEELSKFLKEELASRGASQEAIDAVSLTLDSEGNKAMYVPPVAQNSLEWIQSIITSMINKNVIDINTPGSAFIQRSVWNMEGPTTVQDAQDLPSTIYEGRELLMINEEGTMDCVVSIDFYEDIIPEDVVRDSDGHIVYEKDDEGNYLYTTTTDENGSEIRKRIPKKQKKSFEAARQWLIDNNIISGRKSNGEWSNATANFIGSRIPTQAQSSIHALRCVDVLPVVRDTIVLPKEFTKITGADFDIDKLFLSRFYFNNKSGKVSTQFKEGTHEYYANRLLSRYIALLKDAASVETENYNRTSHSNHASIDGDTKLLKDIIKDLEERKEEEPLDPFSQYSLWMNAQTKTEFITGKFGIGPFALNNNSHILTMLYGVKFKDKGFLGSLGMNRLDLSQDRYGNSILSWLSGLINAHVDVAKDPYISRLNVNKYTYNLVNLMIRTGFGKDTFYLTTQPLMVEMAKAYNNAASQYGTESSKGKSRRQKEAVDEVVFDFVMRNFKLPTDVTSLRLANKVLDGYFAKTRKISVDAAIESLLAKGDDVMHQISKNGIPMDGHARMYNVGGVMMSASEVQYLVYRAKRKFEPYEQSLADLVRYSKIDTKKQGKNVTEQLDYKAGVKKLFEPVGGKDFGLFEDLTEYYNASYIQKKTKNALDLFSDIMGSFTIESTGQFQAQVNKLLDEIGEDSPSADMRKAASRQIMNYIRAGFFNKWAEDNGIDIKGLVTGDNTISDRLEDIRIKIMTDPEYADMRAVDGSIKNYLLAALVQGFQYKENNRITELNVGTRPATHNTAKFVKTLNFMDADHVNDDDMAEAWDELLNDPTHPELQSFARDLIMYSFITSGGNSGNNLFKFIPNSWKLDSYGDNDVRKSYAQYMLDQLYMYQTSREELPIDVHEIILNNWFDDKFVPTVKMNGFYGYYTGRYYYQGSEKPNMTIPVLLMKKNADVQNRSDERYIKILRNSTDPHTPRRYTVYKAIAYTSGGELIYAMVDPKGNKFPRDVIYEMRRNDNPVKESATVAAFNKDFVDFIRIIKGAMGSTGSDLSEIISSFIQNLRDNKNVSNAIAMIDLATKDPTLKRLLEEAALIKSSEEENDDKIFYSSEFYERDKVAQDTESLYIFTDNTDRDSGSGTIDDNSWYALKYGTGHHYPTQTLAVIRGLDNARPISTQRWYHEGAKGKTGRWTDDAFDEFKATVDAEIEDIKEAWRSGKYKRVVFPSGIDGFFNSKKSNINPQRVPLIAQYLDLALRMLEGFITNEVADNKLDAEQNGSRTYRPTQVSGENISSSGSEFAKRLTNPFNNETVEFRGTKFDNAEHAYLTWKSGSFDQRGYDAHGGKVRGTTDFSSNFQLMVDIITAKLQQHPDLVQGINERGGIRYIQNSTHNVVGDKYWESTGQNKFIEALLLAYNNVTAASSKPVATLTKEFVELIKSHIKNDNFTVKNYEFSRIRESLVKLTDALFQYLEDNNVKVEFVEADPNNKAGGQSMIYPTEDGEGWRIEINKLSKDVYLDILHELLHITTTPLDNMFSREFGIELPQQLQAYKLALDTKVRTMEGYKEATQAERDFLDHKITREEYERIVPERMRELLHATESTGEFVSMVVSSNDVQTVLGSITYGERDLFSSIIEWFKDFLRMVFKGNSYIDIGNTLDDITDFLINYKSSYLTPKLITNGFFGNNILETGNSLSRGVLTLDNEVTPTVFGTPTMEIERDIFWKRQEIKDLQDRLNDLNKLNKTIIHTNNGDLSVGVRLSDYGAEVYVGNNKSIFGLVSTMFKINKGLVESNILFPNKYIRKEDINFNRLKNSVKDNAKDIIYSLLKALQNKGVRVIESEWKVETKDENKQTVLSNFEWLYGILTKGLFFEEKSLWKDEYTAKRYGDILAHRWSFKLKANVEVLLNKFEDVGAEVIDGVQAAFDDALSPRIDLSNVKKNLNVRILLLEDDISKLRYKIKDLQELEIQNALEYYGQKLRERCK